MSLMSNLLSRLPFPNRNTGSAFGLVPETTLTKREYEFGPNQSIRGKVLVRNYKPSKISPGDVPDQLDIDWPYEVIIQREGKKDTFRDKISFRDKKLFEKTKIGDKVLVVYKQRYVLAKLYGRGKTKQTVGFQVVRFSKIK
jgi:hypothetical protein